MSLPNIDPRLDIIDDCLYRVAVRVLIVQNSKLLLVQEKADDWWALPGGGVDHGETAVSTLVREVEEELGVPVEAVTSDFRVVHYSIGEVVNGIPRMNLFFKASVPKALLKKTDHVAAWRWFTKDEFLNSAMHASYHKRELAEVVFDAANN